MNLNQDLESLASTITSASSRSDHGHRSKKKTKKSSKAETTLNMSTQVLPYVNSAMELAAGQLGTGTSLRKVGHSNFIQFCAFRISSYTVQA